MSHALAKSTGKPTNKKLPSRPGFSLVELLVVIAIITVLLAILFTVVHAAIKAVHALKG